MRPAYLAAAIAALVVAPGMTLAQHAHGGAHGDSAHSAMQARGRRVMGVDQYTSTHRFETLADGGRIELRRDVEDPAGTATIRAHLREVARRLSAGDFALSEAVHAREIPGAATLAARRARVRYEFRELPRGGEVRITTTDAAAVKAVHEFLAFQRMEHRVGK
jgi:hypothetical protein